MAEQEENMSFLGHLEELRWRLVKMVIAILIFAIVIFVFTEWITMNIFLNLAEPDFPIFQFFCELFNICVDKINIKWQSVEMTGQFSTNLMMAVVGGIVLAFPWIFYQIWSFVKPGLKAKEVKSARGIVFFVSVLFFIGIAFGYFVIAPLTVQFFGNWTMADQIKNQITINSYLKTIVSTVFFTGVLFLLPVVIQIFSKLGIITSTWLKKYRKHSFVVVLILAAIITPPDLITQIIVAIPIMVLYELGIRIAKRIEKKRYNDSLVK
jgi:sec-independent protein translocase protein TatC